MSDGQFYACKDRSAFKSRLMVQDGWYQDGYSRTPRMVMVPFSTPAGCQYQKTALGLVDARCGDCSHKESYRQSG